MRVLFYAINHVGLGHVVRLSVLQRFISRTGAADCRFFSESHHASSFFTCEGTLVDAGNATARQRWLLLETGLRRTVDVLKPDVLVCDTYWVEAAPSIQAVQRRNGRAVLLLRMTDSLLMAQRLAAAMPFFDSVLLPHHPDEVRWTYRGDSRLLRLLDSPQVAMIGPVCRAAATHGRRASIIFTVGAGGEWPGASKLNTVDAFIRAYVAASRLLTARGYAKPKLAAGKFLRLNDELEASFDVFRTNVLYRHFGPDTTVVTRGGYNTVWEAVAAKSRLVVCGTRDRLDDIKARSAFIRGERLGRSAYPDARTLVDAIVEPWTQEPPALERWSGVVNAGLELAADEITGGTFLRARERATGYPRTGSSRMPPQRTRLIARFESVDARRPSSNLETAVRLAIELGYLTEVRLARSSGGTTSRRLRALEKAGAVLRREGESSGADCVSVLAWPGPRVRNELRVSEELAAKTRTGVNTGLAVHADRVPLFLTEYLLRLFSLHNR